MKNLLLLPLLLLSCTTEEIETSIETAEPEFRALMVQIRPTSNGSEDLTGLMTIHHSDKGMTIGGEISGLEPGEHALHVHQFGNCWEEDGTGTGGHFNPNGTKHGKRGESEYHDGDIGNIIADDNGVANFIFLDKNLDLDWLQSIVGRGIIIHAGADDYTSQPSGAAGPRVACGVIGILSPEDS